MGKLANRSLREVLERGRQGANIVSERLGLSSQTKLQSDADLFHRFSNSEIELNSSNFLEHFRKRKKVPFYASFEDREDTLSELKISFPSHTRQIIVQADRICDGVFSLLGYEDLYFGATVPDWHFEPISGKKSPRTHWSKINEVGIDQTGDKKVIWELNRHQYFTTLGQAYWLTGEEKYSETFVSHLLGWCENNPPKTGVNWLSSLEIAFRSMSWIWAFHFFRESPKFNVAALKQMLKFLHINGRHLETYLSTYFSPNTHLTGEALGLYFLGFFLPEFPEAARWRGIGYRILMDMLDIHVRPDGVYCEQSSHYHRYTADFYLNLLILRRAQGEEIEPKHVEKLNLLLDHLLQITQPDGRTPLFGDEDGGRFLSLDLTPVDDFRPTLALGAALFARGDLKFAAGEPSPELLWLLGPEVISTFESLPAEAPRETIKAFPSGGIFCARNSWEAEADHIVIDCGPHGFLNGGHAHADALNVILSVHGRPLFVDSGTLIYTADPEARDRHRSTAAHNCLTVDGMSSSIPAGPFSWKSVATSSLLEWKESDDGVFFRGMHDGFVSLGVEYAREVEFEGKGPVTITERISSRLVHSFEVNFILAPGLSAVIGPDSIVIRESEQLIATIETVIAGPGIKVDPIWEVEDWQVSFRYGAQTPAKRFRLNLSGSGDISILNRIRGDQTMSASLQ